MRAQRCKVAYLCYLYPNPIPNRINRELTCCITKATEHVLMCSSYLPYDQKAASTTVISNARPIKKKLNLLPLVQYKQNETLLFDDHLLESASSPDIAF